MTFLDRLLHRPAPPTPQMMLIDALHDEITELTHSRDHWREKYLDLAAQHNDLRPLIELGRTVRENEVLIDFNARRREKGNG